ncbi:MAG: cytidylate kinase family protein [Bacteroidota bacterium]|nr:cytidylate kinase family protein [Bacteroidota bacterium]
MKNKITLSGLAGSGKTTIGKLLAEKLSYKFISLGNFARKIAKEKYNMNINEFQNYCSKHPEIDYEIDNEFKKYCNETNKIIIDYRLGFHFIDNALNVFLKVSEGEAAKRLFRAKRSSEFGIQNEDDIKQTMNKRNIKMKERFIKIYNVDFTELSNYDTIIDTDKFTEFSDIVNLITSEL